MTNDDNSVVSATDGPSFRRRRPVIRCVASAMQRIVGITPEYTRGDKAIAWGVFAYSSGYGFGLCFLGVVAWNAIRPWPVEWWSLYFVGIYFVVPCIVACVTTVWFGVGGVIGLRQLFRDLRARKETNVLDDGRVEGHVSLADKQRLEAVDRENKEQTK